MVVGLEEHDRRLVGPGRLRHAPGRATRTNRVTARLRCRRCPRPAPQPVVGARRPARRRPRRTRRRPGGQPRGGGGGGQGRDVHRVGQVLAHPAADLGPGVRVGADRADRVERRTGAGGEDEGDRHEHLADHDERLAVGEGVQRGADAALDRVLDRHHGGVDVAGAQGGERRVDRAQRQVLGARGRRPRPQRHLGERALRPQVRVAGHRRVPVRPVVAGGGERLLLLGGQRGVAGAVDDALGVGAGLPPRVDRAEHEAVAPVVDDGGEKDSRPPMSPKAS